MRSFLRAAVALGLLIGIGGIAQSASATGIQGGVTDTIFEKGAAYALLGPAGVTTALTGTASVAGSAFAFPVTGGDVDLSFLEGTIEHAGSGIDFNKGGNTVRVTDLQIDLTNLLVNANVEVLLGGVSQGPAVSTHLFDIFTVCGLSGATDPCLTDHNTIRLDGYGARLTDGALATLGSTLGLAAGTVDALNDHHLGILRLEVAFVPEPGTALLLGAGLAGLASFRKRARA